ncbi:hypothetical protein BC938DRAFT_483708 [Jimgerdemannia flammicorona]|uniref:Yeast cell wall synthesis Kre9/Knh1-like N-terminal domain-containing protein n=1 Tax=Jimgerdemannia flammicorona TaxID=994334 RepID=A0A433QBK0_9FUNG|nr:hypothetical protein BC938DRAFT_483708 [Jimgerdemannia flammicorona]
MVKLAFCFALLLLSVGLARAGSVWIVQIPALKTTFTTGKINKIVWIVAPNPAKTTPDPANIRIDLLEGPGPTVGSVVVMSITNKTSLTGLHFDWNVSTTLSTNSDYFIRIGTDSSDFVYSALFNINNPPPPVTSVVIVTSTIAVNATTTADRNSTSTSTSTTTSTSTAGLANATTVYATITASGMYNITPYAIEPSGASITGGLGMWTVAMAAVMTGLMAIW